MLATSVNVDLEQSYGFGNSKRYKYAHHLLAAQVHIPLILLSATFQAFPTFSNLLVNSLGHHQPRKANFNTEVNFPIYTFT